MSFAREEDPLKPARELSEGIRAMGTTVSVEEWFEELPLARDRPAIPEKLTRGEPLLEAGRLRARTAVAARVFALLLDAFREHLAERHEDWERLEHVVRRGDLAASELLEATLQHRWDLVQGWARGSSLDADSLQFFSLYLARPFRQQAARRLWDETWAGLWQEGYCPVCGHGPALGRLIGGSGRRRLWCCGCNTSWPFARIACPFCQCHVQDQLGYLTVNEFPSCRIYVCDRCRRYLKTIVCPEEESAGDDWDYDRDYFSTVVLDPIALGEGYIAEPVWRAHGELSVDRPHLPNGRQPGAAD